MKNGVAAKVVARMFNKSYSSVRQWKCSPSYSNVSLAEDVMEYFRTLRKENEDVA